MTRYLKDEDLGWVRVHLRNQYQADGVALALNDFASALRYLSHPWGSFANPMDKARWWSEIIRGLGNPEPGTVVRVQ